MKALAFLGIIVSFYAFMVWVVCYITHSDVSQLFSEIMFEILN